MCIYIYQLNIYKPYTKFYFPGESYNLDILFQTYSLNMSLRIHSITTNPDEKIIFFSILYETVIVLQVTETVICQAEIITW